MFEVEDRSIELVEVTAMDNSYQSLFFDHTPHIHIHTLPAYLAEPKITVSEICCHVCATSLYIRYQTDLLDRYPQGFPQVEEVRDNFTLIHSKCGEKDVTVDGVPVASEHFKSICPTTRSKTITIDLTSY